MEHKLIAAVRRYPCLYDRNSVDYHNKWRKRRAWQAVEAAVCVKLQLCQSRWRSLRDRYVKEVTRKPKESKWVDPPTPWIHLEALSFLRTHLKRKKSYAHSVWANDNAGDFKCSPKSSSEGYLSLEQPTTCTRSKPKRYCPSASSSFDAELENDMELTSFPSEYQEETTTPFEPAQLPPQEDYQHETYVSVLPELASPDSCSASDISQQPSERKFQPKTNQQFNTSFGASEECVALNVSQMTESQGKGRNDDYYKVLDTYMKKLSEEDQDEIKIDILKMVHKRSRGNLT